METKREYWSKLIAEQEASGRKVRPFCRERGIGEHSFYQWRKRLSEYQTVRFAVLETKMASAEMSATLELVLSSGERLRISPGADAATLRARCWTQCADDPPAGQRTRVSVPGADRHAAEL